MRRETGNEQSVQVRYDEGVAIHIGPEPCVAVRKGGGEASVGERIGQLLSIIKIHIPGRRHRCEGRRQQYGHVNASARTARCRRRNWHVQTLVAREPGDPTHDRWQCEKSDSAILAGKPTNKAEQSAAESVERRVEAKGNTGQQSTYWAQDRESVSQALDRIRKVARHRKKEKFTSLFHHITVQLLREAFFELKENAAPGVDGLTQVRRAAAPARGCRPGRQNRPEGDCRSAKRDL